MGSCVARIGARGGQHAWEWASHLWEGQLCCASIASQCGEQYYPTQEAGPANKLVLKKNLLLVLLYLGVQTAPLNPPRAGSNCPGCLRGAGLLNGDRDARWGKALDRHLSNLAFCYHRRWSGEGEFFLCHMEEQDGHRSPANAFPTSPDPHPTGFPHSQPSFHLPHHALTPCSLITNLQDNIAQKSQR